MNRPQNTPRTDSLLFHEDISMTVRTHRSFPEQTVRILVSLCGSIGVLLTMQGFFAFPVPILSLCIFSAALAVVLQVARARSPRLGFVLILAAFAVVPVEILLHKEAAAVGANAVYRTMRAHILWQRVFESVPQSAGVFTEADCIRFICDLTVIALAALLEYSDILLQHPQSGWSGFFIRFLITFPFLECGLYFGLETSPAAVILLIAFWVGTLTLRCVRVPGKIAREQGRTAILQEHFAAETEKGHSIREHSALSAAAAVLVLGALCTALTRNYVRSEKMLEMRSNFRNWYQSFSFRDFTGFLQKIPIDFGPNIVSDEIDFSRARQSFDGHTALHVSVGSALTPSDYYLRSLSRPSYTGHGWGIASHQYRGTSRLFERLTEQERMPQLITHSSHLNDLRRADGKLPVVEMTVTAMRPEASVYLPYQALLTSSCRFRYDLDIEMDDTKSVTFWMVADAQPDWTKLSAQTAPSDDPLVTEYEDFVQDSYLSVPESDAMQALYDDFLRMKPNPAAPLDLQLEAIRTYIWSHADYTLTPAPMPADADLAAYFLLEGHRGWCAHYATAAVLLCRMSGIPARYAQGYVIPQNSFGAVKDGRFEIDVPDYQAHAWAEIYVPGFGWTPFEFTEGIQENWYEPRENPAQTSTATATSTSTTTTTTTTAATTSLTRSATTEATAQAQPDGSISPEAWKLIKRILLTVLFIALAVCLWLFWHETTVRRRKAAMESKDPARAADASYSFLVRLLSLCNIRQETKSHEEFAEEAEALGLLQKGRIAKAVTLMQHAAFSRDGASAEDAAFVRKTAEMLAQEMLHRAKPPRRFLLRFFRHIVR